MTCRNPGRQFEPATKTPHKQPDIGDWPAYARELLARLESTYEAAYGPGVPREDEIRLARHFHDAQARFERQGPAVLKRALDELDEARRLLALAADDLLAIGTKEAIDDYLAGVKS